MKNEAFRNILGKISQRMGERDLHLKERGQDSQRSVSNPRERRLQEDLIKTTSRTKSSDSSSVFDSEDESESLSEYDFEMQQRTTPNAENETVKGELQRAIEDGREQIRKQKLKNYALCERSSRLLSENVSGNSQIKMEDLHVSDIKYKATLEHIYKVRGQLKMCKEQFKKTTEALNRTLTDKMTALSDLRQCFMNLKNEVQQKALHSSKKKRRSEDKDDSTVKELQMMEEQADHNLQRQKMKVIRLKVELERQTNDLRKKENFENGLHLIDFEKLKIENQNLNEKMEGKNEELVKLHNKKATTVQVLAHIRKRLTFQKQRVALRQNEFDKESIHSKLI